MYHSHLLLHTEIWNMRTKQRQSQIKSHTRKEHLQNSMKKNAQMLWIKPFLAFLTAAQPHTHKERKDYLNISYSILRNRSPYHLLETLNKTLFWHIQEKVTTDKEWKENHKIQDKVQVISNFIFNTVTMAAVDFANKQKERRWYIPYWEGIQRFFF